MMRLENIEDYGALLRPLRIAGPFHASGTESTHFSYSCITVGCSHMAGTGPAVSLSSAFQT